MDAEKWKRAALEWFDKKANLFKMSKEERKRLIEEELREVVNLSKKGLHDEADIAFARMIIEKCMMADFRRIIEGEEEKLTADPERCPYLTSLDLCRLHWGPSPYQEIIEKELGYNILGWDGDCPFKGRESECLAYSEAISYKKGGSCE